MFVFPSPPLLDFAASEEIGPPVARRSPVSLRRAMTMPEEALMRNSRGIPPFSPPPQLQGFPMPTLVGIAPAQGNASCGCVGGMRMLVNRLPDKTITLESSDTIDNVKAKMQGQQFADTDATPRGPSPRRPLQTRIPTPQIRSTSGHRRAALARHRHTPQPVRQ
ncbi:hypothetical protein BD410DRAFT_794163 [Rickenella mellea]|uniref:Ubiquitin-like domain-containing protein n=1 Tax=Rickenella mellea TaxID=50990 RepID=A0A4Y7PRN4_9AGAM|nr:hypothetical protein BD410DRAFT_794163 [Rickenella mellea]